MAIRSTARRDCRADRCPAKAIFSCLTPGQDARLGHERLARHYEAGQVVIHHDTPALAILSVHSGQVKLTRSASNGGEVVVGVRGPGELLGVREVPARSHQVSAETLEPSIPCAVPRDVPGRGADCPGSRCGCWAAAGDYLLAES
jgi:CRP-like cAMP-binding protein